MYKYGKGSKLQKNTITRATQKHFESLDGERKITPYTKSIAESILNGKAPSPISNEVFGEARSRIILANELRKLRAQARNPQTKEAYKEAIKRIEFNQALIKAKKAKK